MLVGSTVAVMPVGRGEAVAVALPLRETAWGRDVGVGGAVDRGVRVLRRTEVVGVRVGRGVAEAVAVAVGQPLGDPRARPGVAVAPVLFPFPVPIPAAAPGEAVGTRDTLGRAVAVCVRVELVHWVGERVAVGVALPPCSPPPPRDDAVRGEDRVGETLGLPVEVGVPPVGVGVPPAPHLPLLALYSRLCDATAVGVGVGEPELSREAVGAAEALGGAFVGLPSGVAVLALKPVGVGAGPVGVVEGVGSMERVGWGGEGVAVAEKVRAEAVEKAVEEVV